MKRALPYPLPWQDAPTLCAHLCISDGTIDNWVRDGILPPARMVGGKRMWKWSEVDQWLTGEVDTQTQGGDLAKQVYEATRLAIQRQRR